MTCNLIPGDEGYSGTHAIDQKGMCGTMVSSLHKLKDRDKGTLTLRRAPIAAADCVLDGGFFVFGDVSVKRLGEHRLLLSLYEIKKEGSAQFLKSIVSDTFTGEYNSSRSGKMLAHRTSASTKGVSRP